MSLSIEGLKEASKFLVPVKALGDIYIDAAEKLVDLQMESSKVYGDIAFGQLKRIPDIRNIEEAGDFFWGQIQPISEFNKQLLKDWKSLVALNTELTNDCKAVFSSKKASEPVKSIIAPEKAEAEPVAKATRAKRNGSRAGKKAPATSSSTTS